MGSCHRRELHVPACRPTQEQRLLTVIPEKLFVDRLEQVKRFVLVTHNKLAVRPSGDSFDWDVNLASKLFTHIEAEMALMRRTSCI